MFMKYIRIHNNAWKISEILVDGIKPSNLQNNLFNMNYLIYLI